VIFIAINGSYTVCFNVIKDGPMRNSVSGASECDQNNKRFKSVIFWGYNGSLNE